MGRIAILLISIFLTCISYGQNRNATDSCDIDLISFLPSDFDPSSPNLDGCGIPTFYNAYTYMDTFRVLFRKQFVPYLSGRFLEGHILNIDSITEASSLIDVTNDSIYYLYASFNLINQYKSPHDPNIHTSPIPDDVVYDSIEGFQYYNYLKSMQDDTIERKMSVCIMVTKQELEKMLFADGSGSSRKILLRTVSDSNGDFGDIVFCFQFFLEGGYSAESLMKEDRIARYKLVRYKKLYYDIFKREFRGD